MRLSRQFQACLFFLRKDFEHTKSTNNFHPLRSFYARKKPLPLSFFICLFLFLLVGFGWFAFLYAQNLFVKKKINRLEIVLVTSFYYTTVFDLFNVLSFWLVQSQQNDHYVFDSFKASTQVWFKTQLLIVKTLQLFSVRFQLRS